MNFESCMKERRSVRKFASTPILPETLTKIVETARFAPSWKNTQVARYHAVLDPQMREQIAENCVLGFTFNAKTISRCQALMILTVKEKISGYEPDGSFSTHQGGNWEIFDAGIAAQSFCLSAWEQGVGSVILGIFDEEKIRDYVPLPADEKVVALIALGYPEEAPKAAPPRKEPEELLTIH